MHKREGVEALSVSEEKLTFWFTINRWAAALRWSDQIATVKYVDPKIQMASQIRAFLKADFKNLNCLFFLSFILIYQATSEGSTAAQG